MYLWKNSHLKKQYDLEKVAAKNHGISPFTNEELADISLKSKAFSEIHDSKTKRLLELAFILGTLNGLQRADELLENVPKEEKPNNSSSSVPVQPAILPECLYCLACKVKNRQEKLIYTVLTVKARGEEEAHRSAATECGMKNQTLIQCKTIKSYTADSMQFQFGIGKKELDALTALGRKLL